MFGRLGEVLGGLQRALQVRGQLPLQLVATVLEPDFHLGLGELQGAGQTRSLRAAQVALHVKGGLQLEDLSLGEDGASLLLHRGFGDVLRLLQRVLPAVRTRLTGTGAWPVKGAVVSGVCMEVSGLYCGGKKSS